MAEEVFEPSGNVLFGDGAVDRIQKQTEAINTLQKAKSQSLSRRSKRPSCLFGRAVYRGKASLYTEGNKANSTVAGTVSFLTPTRRKRPKERAIEQSPNRPCLAPPSEGGEPQVDVYITHKQHCEVVAKALVPKFPFLLMKQHFQYVV